MSAIIVHPSLKHAFKSFTSLTYHIVLLPTVGKGRGCLLYHIVSLQVNRICLDFLHIVLTWRSGSEPLTGARPDEDRRSINVVSLLEDQQVKNSQE